MKKLFASLLLLACLPCGAQLAFKAQLQGGGSSAHFSPAPVSYTPLNDSTGVLANGNVVDNMAPSRVWSAPGTYYSSTTGNGNIDPCCNTRAFSDCILNNNIRGLTTSDSALNFTADQIFSVCAWIQLDNACGGLTGAIAANYDFNTTSGFTMQADSGALNVYIYDSGSTLRSASSGVTAVSGTWYFVASGWDGANLWISVNAGAKQTFAVAHTKAVSNTYRLGTSIHYCIYGSLGGCGLWFTTLSGANLTELYNGGNGLASSKFAP